MFHRTKAPDLQDILVMPGCTQDAMRQQQQFLKARATRRGHHYHTARVKGVPTSHRGQIQIHVRGNLSFGGRLAAYQLVDPTWQPNVINVQIPFGDAGETVPEELMEAYRQLAILGATVIIGDFTAAPNIEYHGGQLTLENTAPNVSMQPMGLEDRTASIQGQVMHRPLWPGSTDSRFDLCYTDPTHVEVILTRYHDLPSKGCAFGRRPPKHPPRQTAAAPRARQGQTTTRIGEEPPHPTGHTARTGEKPRNPHKIASHPSQENSNWQTPTNHDRQSTGETLTGSPTTKPGQKWRGT